MASNTKNSDLGVIAVEVERRCDIVCGDWDTALGAAMVTVRVAMLHAHERSTTSLSCVGEGGQS
jgi:hypothetical protein